MLQIFDTLRFLNGGRSGGNSSSSRRKRPRVNNGLSLRKALPRLQEKLGKNGRRRKQQNRKQEQQKQHSRQRSRRNLDKLSTEDLINSLEAEADASTDLIDVSFRSGSMNNCVSGSCSISDLHRSHNHHYRGCGGGGCYNGNGSCACGRFSSSMDSVFMVDGCSGFRTSHTSTTYTYGGGSSSFYGYSGGGSSSLTLEQSCHLRTMNESRTKTLIDFATEQDQVHRTIRGETLLHK